MADQELESRVAELVAAITAMTESRAVDDARFLRIVVVGFVAFAGALIVAMIPAIFMMFRCRP